MNQSVAVTFAASDRSAHPGVSAITQQAHSRPRGARSTVRAMDDSKPTHHLTRRQALASLGLAGAGLAVGSAAGVPAVSGVALASAVALTAEQEEGPYYVDLEKVRADVVGDREGVPLHLAVTVVNDKTGKVVKGAAVDLWQCDASGVYSDESAESTKGVTWLRGVQLTDAAGVASFVTIYPGHYAGRATHIHAKVHVSGKVSGTTYSGGHVSHTGQMFLPDAISTKVYRLSAYTNDKATRVLNTADRVYTQQGGAKSQVKLARRGSSVAKGYTGTITLAIDPSATPAATGTGH